ncbi:hypothetical protein POVCU1_012880 [Plasmodium ovale curtisi]|uniref:Uncharacterized protein n=1 Tax=Plasmodium ovale curtisi TaxID=864141 RepID=A0A1A8W226_PLAOA|nr:hypothetical protein POVCU1_012880 [Plasmodium ovale curtisi]
MYAFINALEDSSRLKKGSYNKGRAYNIRTDGKVDNLRGRGAERKRAVVCSGGMRTTVVLVNTSQDFLLYKIAEERQSMPITPRALSKHLLCEKSNP